MRRADSVAVADSAAIRPTAPFYSCRSVHALLSSPQIMRKDGATRGFGFVTFVDPVSAEKALLIKQVGPAAQPGTNGMRAAAAGSPGVCCRRGTL
jgi:hypothetical protein